MKFLPQNDPFFYFFIFSIN